MKVKEKATEFKNSINQLKEDIKNFKITEKERIVKVQENIKNNNNELDLFKQTVYYNLKIMEDQ